MNKGRPPPGGSLPPHLASPSQLQMLQERVQMKYGSFGARPPEEEADARVLADNFFKRTLLIIGIVFGSTFIVSLLSHPTFDGPGVWANSFRFDTVFIAAWGPAIIWAMVRLRLWKSIRTYLILGLFIEAFSEAMFRERGDGYWDTLMWPAAVGFFGTLKEFAGIPGASLSVFTLVTVGLLYRAVKGKKSIDYTPPPKFARSAMLLFLFTVIGLAAFGIARGGEIEWTFRQTIHLLQLPLVALVFLYALRIPDDLAAVGTIFVTTAVIRSVLVAYVYFGVCVPQGITLIPGKPEWCTNHSDTVLFVVSLMILLAHALEQRKKQTTYRAMGIAAIILAGIILNNRRLAFVSLGAASLITYLALKPSKRKTRVTVALAVLVPLFIGYVLVASELPGESPFVKPAKIVVSVMEQKDASSQSRDIENDNLIFTLRLSPIVTKGFGHEYEYAPNHPPVDLGDLFRNFRLIAHNGVLWIWSVAGPIGFTLLWLIYPLGGTLAMRGYTMAQSPLERSAALASLGAIVVCVSQIWGDQGFNSYMTLITFSVAFAIAARLAVRAQGVYSGDSGDGGNVVY